MPLAHPVEGESKTVEVLKTEKKGSDVNLAAHMLLDGFRNDYEVAVVVSNDSDLVEPVRMVTQEFGKVVGLLNPHRYPSRDLKAVATFYKPIRSGVLAQAQLPQSLRAGLGFVSRPDRW